MHENLKLDKQGTLEMKLTRARAASQYARTKAERQKAAGMVEWCEAQLARAGRDG